MREFLKSLLPMKWYFVFVAVLLVWLAYSNMAGTRILSFENQEQWNANGPGTQYGIRSHK